MSANSYFSRNIPYVCPTSALDFLFLGTLEKPCCIELQLKMKRHFAKAFFMPVKPLAVPTVRAVGLCRERLGTPVLSYLCFFGYVQKSLFTQHLYVTTKCMFQWSLDPSPYDLPYHLEIDFSGGISTKILYEFPIFLCNLRSVHFTYVSSWSSRQECRNTLLYDEL
jgi:hypothetical protein